MSQYIDKHIRYADLESDEWVKQKTGQGQSASASALFMTCAMYQRRNLDAASDEQRTYAFGSVELVSRHAEEIHVQRVHLHWNFAH